MARNGRKLLEGFIMNKQKRDKLRGELVKANGKRRVRTFDNLEEIEEIAYNKIKDFKGFKKNLKFLQVSNILYMCNNYHGDSYYTKFIATFNAQGLIRDIRVWESRAANKSYGEDDVVLEIPEKHINTIIGIPKDIKLQKKYYDFLQEGIIEGKI
jgi:hypothetical protein